MILLCLTHNKDWYSHLLDSTCNSRSAEMLEKYTWKHCPAKCKDISCTCK